LTNNSLIICPCATPSETLLKAGGHGVYIRTELFTRDIVPHFGQILLKILKNFESVELNSNASPSIDNKGSSSP